MTAIDDALRHAPDPDALEAERIEALVTSHAVARKIASASAVDLLAGQAKKDAGAALGSATTALANSGEALSRLNLGDLGKLDFAELQRLSRVQGQLSSNYVGNISASKIISGTILAQMLTLAGTEASNNRAQLMFLGDSQLRMNDGVNDRLILSNAGLSLRFGARDDAVVDDNVGQSITSFRDPRDNPPAGAMWFFAESAGNRGVNVRADGISGDTLANGRVMLVATKQPNNTADQADSYASLTVGGDSFRPEAGVIANRAGVRVANALLVNGPTRLQGPVEIAGTLVNRGGQKIEPAFEHTGEVAGVSGIAHSHGLGVRPSSVTGSYSRRSENIWRPLGYNPNLEPSPGNVFVAALDDTMVSVNNQTPGTVDYRIQVWR